MNNLGKPLLAVLIFCLVQALGGIVVSLAFPCLAAEINTARVLAPLLLGTSLITILIVWLGMKMMRIPETFSPKGISLRTALMALAAAITGIFATDLLSEFADLPDLMEDSMSGLASSVLGVLAIAVVGPVTEELIFREAIMGHMMRRGSNVWTAIIFSSLCFGIIHFNPAQVPFAFAVGLILGIIYVRTGNIVLTSIIHVINNSFSCLEMNILGEKAKDFSYIELLGGTAVTSIVITVCGAISIWLLRKLWMERELS